MKYYKVSVKHHRPGIWIKPENAPLYGLFKTVETGSFRMKPARSYTKDTATWRFAKYLTKPNYYLAIVERLTAPKVKPERWEDTNLT